ncbi:MAG TPA: hypothetical protein ENO00_08595 [Deltaproteobacteria bacterium]|nr:hypothetical protein [Deltaproteobacteria bacterium]
MKYSLIAFVATIGVSGQILLKRGLNAYSNLKFENFITKIFSILLDPNILLAMSFYVIGIIGYLFLLSKVELTNVYPICTSLTFGGITFFGWLFLHESVSFPKILGIILIAAGIMLIEHYS